MLRQMFAMTAAILLVSCGGGDKSGGDTASSAPDASAAAPPAAESPANPAQTIVMCTSCHSTAAHENRIGPSLFGVFGRKAGSEPGFAYSEAMKNSGRTWDEASLDAYLTNPRIDMPGNKMTFAGIDDAAKRKAAIDYLKTLK